ncbi:MAG: 3-hydroxyacyl-CoA dehydrogenase family protein [Agriterribacter sp.]
MNEKIKIGTVGLGLMGSSIAACILAAGHPVISAVKDISEKERAMSRITGFLSDLKGEGLLQYEPASVIKKLIITDNISDLADCTLVIESIFENLEDKQGVYAALEMCLSSTSIIGSNTSAIPVSVLQSKLVHPERFVGIHWAEPAHVTRFMEIICGDKTDAAYAEKVKTLAESWNKEPSLLKKDIRGFITNRIMYAMIREAFHLVEKGYASYEDVDRSLRNDLGYWITFAGPFRFMDLTGIPAYAAVMKDLFPELDNSTTVPQKMQQLVVSGAMGTQNAKGFYSYTKESAEHWEALFNQFSYEIRKLSEKYPQNIGDKTDE